MNSISFVIACESYIISAGLENIIRRFPGAEAVRFVYNDKDLQTTVNKVKPDFLIIHASFLEDPHANINLKFKKNLKTKFILLSGERLKNESFEHFQEHISLTDDKMLIINKISNLIESLPKGKKQKSDLTSRERDVLRLVALGHTNKEIAEKLFISIHTVITHRKNISGKTDIRTASGLTAYAILKKIILPEEINLQ